MATSGDIVYAPKAAEIIQAALELVRVVPEGEVGTSAQAAAARRALNGMLKSWQGDGVTVGRRGQASFATVVSQATYTLTPRPLSISSVRIQVGAQQTPIPLLSRHDYLQLPNKASAGRPLSGYFDQQHFNRTLTLWPVPNSADWSIHYSFERMVEDVTLDTEDVDIPQEHIEAVTYGVADRLLDLYGGSGAQEADARIRVRASELYERLKARERDPVVRFVPSYHWRDQ